MDVERILLSRIRVSYGKWLYGEEDMVVAEDIPKGEAGGLQRLWDLPILTLSV